MEGLKIIYCPGCNKHYTPHEQHFACWNSLEVVSPQSSFNFWGNNAR